MTTQQLLTTARSVIDSADRVVVLTGAGISTDSGIPDFRGPNGVWTKNPGAEKASNLRTYLDDPDVRRAAWQARLQSLAWEAKPNDGHRAIVGLERRGKLHAVITQNIDELHQRAGTSPHLVIEVHGTMHRSHCWGCGDELPMAAMLTRVRSGEADPSCEKCGGIIKSATISFGQNLVPEVIEAAMIAAAEADVLVAIGSTLQVFPIANAVPLAHRAGAAVMIVNNQPTPFDHIATVLQGSISDILPVLFSSDV